MVIDSSAIIAITNKEPGFEEILKKLIQNDIKCCMSAVTRFEIFIVTLNRWDEETWQETLELLEQAEVEIVPVTEETLPLVEKGFQTYGKGRHPAKLNFGDCFSYALAKARNEPLLFIGNDFTKTDIESVL